MPSETNIPTIASAIPPKTGCGTDVMKAPNLPIIAMTAHCIPATTSTYLLPICNDEKL